MCTLPDHNVPGYEATAHTLPQDSVATHLQVLDDFLQNAEFLAGVALPGERDLLPEGLESLFQILLLLQQGVVAGGGEERQGERAHSDTG